MSHDAEITSWLWVDAILNPQIILNFLIFPRHQKTTKIDLKCSKCGKIGTIKKANLFGFKKTKKIGRTCLSKYGCYGNSNLGAH